MPMSYVKKINNFRACASKADLLELSSGTEALAGTSYVCSPSTLADPAMAGAIFILPIYLTTTINPTLDLSEDLP